MPAHHPPPTPSSPRSPEVWMLPRFASGIFKGLPAKVGGIHCVACEGSAGRRGGLASLQGGEASERDAGLLPALNSIWLKPQSGAALEGRCVAECFLSPRGLHGVCCRLYSGPGLIIPFASPTQQGLVWLWLCFFLKKKLVKIIVKPSSLLTPPLFPGV